MSVLWPTYCDVYNQSTVDHVPLSSYVLKCPFAKFVWYTPTWFAKMKKKRTGWLKSTVLENGWELGGEIWQFFRLDAETFKSGVFLCNSKIWGISYDHIEHKWNEKKKNQDPKISRFSVLSKNYLRSYYGARIDPRWIFYALRSVWKIVWTGKRITQNQIMT